MPEELTHAQVSDFWNKGIDPLLAQVLVHRGLKEVAAMRRFIDARYDQIPDPLLLIDMQRALARVRNALATGEHITVFGDFDADGVSSAALLLRAFKMLGHPKSFLDWYIPHRFSDERGLSLKALDVLAARGTTLVITCDCGSSDVAAVAYAREMGIDVVITDHHQPPVELPAAHALVNPWREDCTYPERVLCGVGVAFKLVQALYRVYGRSQEEEQALLDLVAIGTIADVAQLTGENHVLVRRGLQKLNATVNPGLRALMQVAKLQPGKVSERDVAYGLAPRLNAAGRMSHPDIALKLLVTDDSGEARTIAQELEGLNRLRQQQTEQLMELVRKQAQAQIGAPLVLAGGEKEDWPEGIIGLAAGKLAEEMKCPVVLLSRDQEICRGSARSYGGFNLIEALGKTSALLQRYGGHAQAAGFTIAHGHVEDLRQRLLLIFAESTEPAGDERVHRAGEEERRGQGLEQKPEPVHSGLPVVDSIEKPEALTYDLYRRIRELAPFGAGNPEPVFMTERLRLIGCWPSRFGGGSQLRFQAETGRQLSGTYKQACAPREKDTLVTVIFHLEPAWKPPASKMEDDIRLRVLSIERVTAENAQGASQERSS